MSGPDPKELLAQVREALRRRCTFCVKGIKRRPCPPIHMHDRIVTAVHTWMTNDHMHCGLSDEEAEALAALAALEAFIEQLQQERDEALRQRDYDYKRFSEVKAALMEAEERVVLDPEGAS